MYYSAALSPHIVDVELLARGLHIKPAELRDYLQGRIDAVDGDGSTLSSSATDCAARR